MQDRIRGDAGRTTMICVDSYEQGVLQGRYYNYGQPIDGHSFQSLTQLIVGMEHILDSANYPQSFTAVRTFAFRRRRRNRMTRKNKVEKGSSQPLL